MVKVWCCLLTEVIEINPEILGGKPVIKGTRVPVDLILELVELGYTPERIVEEYPHLSKDTITNVLRLAEKVHESVSYEKVKALLKV